MNYSAGLIAPVMGLHNMLFYNNLLNCYVGNVEYEGTDNWGDYIYIEVNYTCPKELLESLQKHDWYKTEIDSLNQTIILVFEPDENTKTKILKPFIEGKYSKIDKDYVEKYFNYKEIDGSKPINRMIFDKDPKLKEYWENKIEVSLPENAEVWSAPKKEKEIYGYHHINI